MDIVRILEYPKDHPHGYARVDDRHDLRQTVRVSNMNMPFQGTFAGKVFKFSEVEFVNNIGEGAD